MYRKHAGYVSLAARRFGVPRDEVEDVVQEVFLVLHRRFDEVEDHATVRRWLGTVALHVSRNRRRSLWRRERAAPIAPRGKLEAAIDHITCPPDEAAALGEARGRMARALADLDATKLEVFVMAELEGKSAKQIAAVVQASPNTVSSRLRLARKELGRALAPPARNAS